MDFGAGRPVPNRNTVSRFESGRTTIPEDLQVCYKTCMPIYEYSCAKCGKTIEVLQKMSGKPLKTHAGCGGRLTKEISASGFQFKGTGWYVTDYARKGQTDSAERAKESAGESAKPAEASGGDKKESSAPSTEKSEKAEKAEKSGKSEKSEKPAKSSSSAKS